MITAIDPNAVRMESDKQQRSGASLTGVDFPTAMNAAGATAATAVSLDRGYQPAAVTQAAISGLAGAPGAFGHDASVAPYYGVSLASTPFASGGYSYGGASFAGGYTGSGASTVGTTPASGWSSQDNYEKSLLLQQMNDSNLEMIVLQTQVQDTSREFQTWTNILKTKSDTELSAVRNMRVS